MCVCACVRVRVYVSVLYTPVLVCLQALRNSSLLWLIKPPNDTLC